MTIALGILASDCVVLGADTEHTWGYLKTSERKVYTTSKAGGLAIAGDGDSGYLKAIAYILTHEFEKDESLQIAVLEQRFQAMLRSFYKEHVIPFAQFPESDRPSFNLVIAAERAGARRLWVTRNASLTPTSYAAVGLGAEYAVSVLSQVLSDEFIDPSKLDSGTAERLTAYAIGITSEHVQDCGKGMHVATVRDGQCRDVDAGVLKTLDSCFSSYARLQAQTVNFVLGYPYLDEEASMANLGRLLRSIRESSRRSEGIQTESRGWRLE
jgi:20S proteasome alpha/beta subunit